MARNVEENEWLSRWTTPLRLARFAHNRISIRKLQIISCAACRLIERHLTSPDLRNDLQSIERFAFGELSASEYHTFLSQSTVAILQMQPYVPEEIPHADAAMYAVASAASGNVVAGMKRTIEWVLHAGEDDEGLSEYLCELFREIVGNPFQPWKICPEWIEQGIRVAPDGTTRSVTSSIRELANTIDREGRFDLMPILADELESAGWNDPSILHHCRNATWHLRGCWVIDLIRGYE